MTSPLTHNPALSGTTRQGWIATLSLPHVSRLQGPYPSAPPSAWWWCRWIYLDGQRNRVWTSHSMALCFFFGPTGVLSHLLTRGLVKIFRWVLIKRSPPRVSEGAPHISLLNAGLHV
jgi:hypothetical protein